MVVRVCQFNLILTRLFFVVVQTRSIESAVTLVLFSGEVITIVQEVVVDPVPSLFDTCIWARASSPFSRSFTVTVQTSQSFSNRIPGNT